MLILLTAYLHASNPITEINKLSNAICLDIVIARVALFRVLSQTGLFGPKVDKHFGLNLGLRRAFCLRCPKI